jgi:hypothetical protein
MTPPGGSDGPFIGNARRYPAQAWRGDGARDRDAHAEAAERLAGMRRAAPA